MRYRVQHTTRYAYGTPVELAAHMVHLRPRPRPWQTVISERITTDPMPARRRGVIPPRRLDYGSVTTDAACRLRCRHQTTPVAYASDTNSLLAGRAVAVP